MSSEKYTPTMEDVRTMYVSAAQGPHDDDEVAIESAAEFDQFVTKIKADAFDEALGRCNDYWPYVPNPYREDGDNDE